MNRESEATQIESVMAEKARIVVRVQPNASQNEVLRVKGGVLHIRSAARPEPGQ